MSVRKPKNGSSEPNPENQRHKGPRSPLSLPSQAQKRKTSSMIVVAFRVWNAEILRAPLTDFKLIVTWTPILRSKCAW
jgi:hypothetical protein